MRSETGLEAVFGSHGSAPERVQPVADFLRPGHVPATGTEPNPESLRAELRDLRELAALRVEWEALALTTIEPNLFAEPAFVLTAAETLPGGDQMRVVAVWSDGGPCGSARILRGLFPIVPPATRLGIARAWRPLHSALGAPLIDATCFDAVMEACLGLLSREGMSDTGALFPMIADDGAFAGALTAFAHRTGRTIRRFDHHERAVLRSGTSGEKTLTAALSAKKLKELRRQLRRLGDIGSIRIESDHEPRAVRRSVELFLAIEASGWKRARGTALLQDDGVAALVRTFTRDLARRGRCRVDTLWAADAPVASAITIDNGERAWFWKIAYDEAFARYSPGVQIAMHVTQAQLDRPTIAMTDSGAIANHPMIDHLWRDRMKVADLFIPVRPGSAHVADLAARGEEVRRQIRAFAKRTYRKVMKGKTS